MLFFAPVSKILFRRHRPIASFHCSTTNRSLPEQSERSQRVGWVERSETHHPAAKIRRWVSLSLNPSYFVTSVDLQIKKRDDLPDQLALFHEFFRELVAAERAVGDVDLALFADDDGKRLFVVAGLRPVQDELAVGEMRFDAVYRPSPFVRSGGGLRLRLIRPTRYGAPPLER
jgi:hypothetical protein